MNPDVFVIHISDRDGNASRVVGPFGSERAATDELTYATAWTPDTRAEFPNVWHHRDDSIAVVVKLQGEL